MRASDVLNTQKGRPGTRTGGPSWARIGLVCGLMACAGACDDDVREEVHIFEGQLDDLDISLGSGEVEVCGADVDHIEVVARITGSRTDLTRREDASRLSLSSDCDFNWHCSVDLVVTVPRHVAASIDTGSGDVFVHGLDGNVSVDTGSGDVLAAALSGAKFRGDTGSGDVRGEAISSVEVEACTGSGDVELGLAGATGAIDVYVDTGSGDVDLTVPRGAYRVEWDTGSGDFVASDIELSRTASDRIRVDTGSGDIAVRGR